MAKGIVVKIWNVKAGANTRSASAQISDSIAYIENPEKVGKPLSENAFGQVSSEISYVMNDLKTVDGLYVGCRHISDIKNATEEMMQVKEFFGKTDGRVATHGVIERMVKHEQYMREKAEDNLSRESWNSDWQRNRIYELEGTIKELEERSVWDVLWKRMKPKKHYKLPRYGRSQAWETFTYYLVAVPIVFVCSGVFLWFMWMMAHSKI